MLGEITNLVNLRVYTHKGVEVGRVENVIIDTANNKIDGIFVGGTNPALVEGSSNVNIPYRWIQAVGDIIILRYFPEKVKLKKEEKKEEEKKE